MPRFSLLLFLLLILLASSSVGYCDIYRYVDDKGVLNMTNELHRVPEKYRGSMIVVREDAPSAAAPLPPLPDDGDPLREGSSRSLDEPFPGTPDEEKSLPHKRSDTAGDSRESRLPTGYSPLLYAVGVILSYLLLSRFLKARKLYIFFFLLLSGLLTVYLMRSYITESHNKYLEIREATDKIQKEMGERQQQRIKIMKDLKGD